MLWNLSIWKNAVPHKADVRPPVAPTGNDQVWDTLLRTSALAKTLAAIQFEPAPNRMLQSPFLHSS